MQRFCGISVAVLTAAILGGCGGGDADDAGSTTNYQINTAWANLYGAAHQWNLSGTATLTGQPNVQVQGPLAISVQTDGSFPKTGDAAKRRNLTTTFGVNGAGGSLDTTTYYLNASNALVGSVASDGTCSVASNSSVPPTSAMLGNSGALADWKVYASCDSGAVQTGSGKSTWSLENANGHPSLCINTNLSGNGYTSTEKDCYAISSAGAINSAGSVNFAFTQGSSVYTLQLATP